MNLKFENFDEAAYRETVTEELRTLSFPELVGCRTDSITVLGETSRTEERLQKARDMIASLSQKKLIEKLKYTVSLFPITGFTAVDPRDLENGALIQSLQDSGIDLFIETLMVPFGFPIEPQELRKAYIEQMLD